MAKDSFGTIFRISTFGEAHGKGIGVVVDGCPAGLEISVEEIQGELNRRRPGVQKHTSKRSEPDQVEILSGVFEGKSTGAPIALWVPNLDADSSKYHPMKDLYRPGHANFTYLHKYGIFDYRGSGRASARETLARVASGAIAKKLIAPIQINAEVIEVAGEKDRSKWDAILEETIKEGDSVGGVIGCTIHHVPIGLGDPIYEKLSAKLAFGMLSLPATKGIEFGTGFETARMRGSSANDYFTTDEEGKITFMSNHHGGILGGISTGMPIDFKVAFKPTSSIKKESPTVDLQGNKTVLQLPEGSRHDPCVALRAPVIVESMAALVLADCLLINRCSKLN